MYKVYRDFYLTPYSVKEGIHVTNEKNQKNLNTGAFTLSHLNSPAGTNIILEIMKLSGVDPSENNLDINEATEIDIAAFQTLLVNNPVVLQKIVAFLRKEGIEFSRFSTTYTPSLNHNQEQTLNFTLTASSFHNLVRLIQTLGLDHNEIILQLTKLQEALNLLNAPSPLPSDMENN